MIIKFWLNTIRQYLIYYFAWEDQRKPQGNISYKALWRGHYKFIIPSSAL